MEIFPADGHEIFHWIDLVWFVDMKQSEGLPKLVHLFIGLEIDL